LIVPAPKEYDPTLLPLRSMYNRLIETIAHIGLWGSLAAFVAAIVLIMSRFTDAIPPDLSAWFRHLQP